VDLHTLRVAGRKGSGFDLDRIGIGNQVIYPPKPLSVALDDGLGSFGDVGNRHFSVWNNGAGVIENGSKKRPVDRLCVPKPPKQQHRCHEHHEASLSRKNFHRQTSE